jgi:integrase
LAAAENQTQAAGISPQAQTDVKGKIINFLWWMEKQAYAQQTIRGAGSALRALIARGANLSDPETIKEALAREKTWSQARRRNVINAYTLFLKFSGLIWEKPKCKVPEKVPFIPKEEELDALIAGSGKKSAAFQQVMKETAARPGEVDRLLWTDIDEERYLIRINNPEKGSNSGVYKVSQKLIGMLQKLPRTDIRVFRGISQRSRRTTFERTRRRLAEKLANPRLLQISFKTYRHWKATMVQHDVKNPWYVKKFLRHKCISNTERYIHIEEEIFGEGCDSDEFISAVASTKDEIKQLIETGFEFVLQKDGLAYFRKRK